MLSGWNKCSVVDVRQAQWHLRSFMHGSIPHESSSDRLRRVIERVGTGKHRVIQHPSIHCGIPEAGYRNLLVPCHAQNGARSMFASVSSLMRSFRSSPVLQRVLQSRYTEHSLLGGHAEVSSAAARAAVEPADTAADRQRVAPSGPGLDHFLRLHDAQQAQQPDSSRAAQALQARHLRSQTHSAVLDSVGSRPV